VNTDLSSTNASVASNRRTDVTISPWVNDPLPNFREILGSRDVARLTRRPRWLLWGLTLMGRFPKKERYRGRPVGWQRMEVMDWLTRGLEAANDETFNQPPPVGCVCSRQHPRQTCLPLECRPPCSTKRTGVRQSFRAVGQSTKCASAERFSLD
jgi:predicted DNA-binding transcriptional regulator AlpA